MQIVFIGAGRLATNLAPALKDAGHSVTQVFSRTQSAARLLAERVGAEPTDSLKDISPEADAYIFSVTDSVLPELASCLSSVLQLGEDSHAVFLHTAGSVDQSVFASCVQHYGVLYPMQTFSKERCVDFRTVSCFVEGIDELSLSVSESLARSVSNRVFRLTSEGRRYLHLAAVFACNFANHCYQLSAEILSRYGIPFDIMLPLIDETAEKVHTLLPVQAQTGPAVRNDESILRSQQQLLAGHPIQAQIYKLMSQSIRQSNKKHLYHD